MINPKKDIILNLNDAEARGWSGEIKKIIKPYKNRFQKISKQGTADIYIFITS